MTEINKYQHSKIYKLWSLETDEIYVGSTCCPLYKRMSKHRNSFRYGDRAHYKLYQEMARLGEASFKIELIEDYPCNNVDELHKREGHWIRTLNATLNRVMAGRTPKEYRDEHKCKMKEYMKQYRINNYDVLTLNEKRYREQHRDKDKMKQYNKQYRIDNYSRLKNNETQYREQNKEKIQAYRSEAHVCTVCGITYTNGHKARHERTKKHLQALELQN